MIKTTVHEKQNFPALRDANCNREEPVRKPSGLFPWRSGHQPKRSFFPRTRFRIPCSVRLSGIPRTDTDKTDMVRLSVCPTDVPKIQLARSSNEGLQEEYFQQCTQQQPHVGDRRSNKTIHPVFITKGNQISRHCWIHEVFYILSIPYILLVGESRDILFNLPV